MKKEWINIMRKSKRLKLSKGNLFWHYSIVPFLLSGPAMATWYLIEYYILGTYSGVRTPSELVLALYPFIILATAFYFIQRRRLKFKELKTSINSDEFKTSVEQTAKELEWKIDHCSDEFVRAHRNWNLTTSWGEMITIIRDKDSILINSICDPNSWISVASWGWNRRNVRTFENKVNACTQQRI